MEPAKALVVDLGERLRRTVAPELVADPRVNGSLFRINRDIRFSADKSPYKTHQAIFTCPDDTSDARLTADHPWRRDDSGPAPGITISR